jgi:hypothetical protein
MRHNFRFQIQPMSLTLNISLITLHMFCLKISIFWDITPCSPLKVNRRFGGTCRPHLHGRRICQARNQGASTRQTEQSACRNSGLYRKQEPTVLLATYSHTGPLLGLFFHPEMKATCSSEKSVDFQWTTWCYMAEDRILRNHNCENLRYYISSTYTHLRPLLVLTEHTQHSDYNNVEFRFSEV